MNLLHIPANLSDAEALRLYGADLPAAWRAFIEERCEQCAESDATQDRVWALESKLDAISDTITKLRASTRAPRKAQLIEALDDIMDEANYNEET